MSHNSRWMKWPSLVGLLVSSWIISTEAVQAETLGQPQLPDSTARRPELENPRYVPGQLIVKYKPSVMKDVSGRTQDARFAHATQDYSRSLDVLHAKYHVLHAKPLFRAEPSQVQGNGAAVAVTTLRQQATVQLQAFRARFPKRTARAPKNAVMPDLSQLYILEVPEGVDIQAAAAEFAKDPHVEYAQPNYLMAAQMIPNDPYYSSSGAWGQSYDDLWGLKNIQADKAWDLTQGEGIVVAVVDTGVDYAHPDIAANMWTNVNEIPNNGIDDDGNGFVDDVQGWDFSCATLNSDGSCLAPAAPGNDPIDRYGHGTHVAGTIAAVGNNALGIIGVAPKAKIMAVKSLNDEGSGNSVTLANGIVYAAQNGADVINNSWGCRFQCPTNPLVEDAVRVAYTQGAVIVFAAGNAGLDVGYFSPQNMTDVKPIVVGASDHRDQIADFSNLGPQVDLMAPGGDSAEPLAAGAPHVNILSLRARNTGTATFAVNTNYLRMSGTSMAAPHVSGAAALVLAHHPEFSQEDVRQALRISADPNAATAQTVGAGTGRVNVSSALDVSTVPRVMIRSPYAGMVFKPNGGDVVISGTATEPYALDYAPYSRRDAVMSWTPIGEPSATPVTDGVLGSWSVQPLEDGPYIIRLRTISGQAFESVVPVMIESARPIITTLQRDLWAHAAAAISGNRVVWADNRTGNGDIYLYDLTANTEEQLTNDPVRQESPAIDGDRVVWVEGTDLYVYNLVTKVKERIPKGSSAACYYPSISGSRVVWQDMRQGNADIYLYDLATGTERQITTDPGPQVAPVILGNRIAWTDYRNRTYSGEDVYLYDLVEEREIPIATNPGTEWFPALYGDDIVWEAPDGIHLRDLVKQTEQRIAKGMFPTISGDRIAYVGDGGGFDIYLYDMSAGTEQRVTADPATQWYPLLSGHHLIWQDHRNDRPDIYAHELKNRAPSIEVPGNFLTVQEGQPLVWSVTARDVDGDPLALSASLINGHPLAELGVVAEEQVTMPGQVEQRFSWTPNGLQAGTYYVKCAATDGQQSAVQVVRIMVREAMRSIAGQVRAGIRTPVAGIQIAVAVQNRRGQQDCPAPVGMTTTDTEGHFGFPQGLRPGTYVVCASDSAGVWRLSPTSKTVLFGNRDRARLRFRAVRR